MGAIGKRRAAGRSQDAAHLFATKTFESNMHVLAPVNIGELSATLDGDEQALTACHHVILRAQQLLGTKLNDCFKCLVAPAAAASKEWATPALGLGRESRNWLSRRHTLGSWPWSLTRACFSFRMREASFLVVNDTEHKSSRCMSSSSNSPVICKCLKGGKGGRGLLCRRNFCFRRSARRGSLPR